MDNQTDTLDYMIAWEQGELSEEDTITLFQHLIDTGSAWQLQGAYGRQAQALINAGLCHPAKVHGGCVLGHPQ